MNELLFTAERAKAGITRATQKNYLGPGCQRELEATNLKFLRKHRIKMELSSIFK